MGRTSAAVMLRGVRVADAEALWYDPERMPAFVDGMQRVVAVEGAYPQAGSGLVWESFAGGRGRVTEHVVRYEARGGQEVETLDASSEGLQIVTFTPAGDDVRMTLELEYRVLDAGPFTALTDFFFIRRAQGDALRRTLGRFARELQDGPAAPG